MGRAYLDVIEPCGQRPTGCSAAVAKRGSKRVLRQGLEANLGFFVDERGTERATQSQDRGVGSTFTWKSRKATRYAPTH